MWSMLRGGRMAGLKFRRQAPVGRYIADFLCHAPKLIVECDGGQHAESAYDVTRDGWFRAQGFQVLRFGNGEVVERRESVAAMIMQAAGRRG